MNGATSTGQGPEATVDQVLDLDALECRLPELTKNYAEAPPFPHIALDVFLDPAVAHATALEVAPVANRAVVFSTGADTWHGHPDPLSCPPDRARRSLAIYYYTVEDAPLARSTAYRARPGDGGQGRRVLDRQPAGPGVRLGQAAGRPDRPVVQPTPRRVRPEADGSGLKRSGGGQAGRVAPTNPGQSAGSRRTTAPVWGASAPTPDGSRGSCRLGAGWGLVPVDACDVVVRDGHGPGVGHPDESISRTADGKVLE